jgi:putative endonuclease
MSDKSWVVYLVRCSDQSLYCGISNDIHRRLADHNSGKGAKYTRSRGPVELIGISPEIGKSDALKLEYRIKKMPADQKLSGLKTAQHEILIQRDFMGLRQDIQGLVKLIDKLIKGN